MKAGSKMMTCAAACLVVLWLVGVGLGTTAGAQATQPAAGAKPTAGVFFKNVQVLKELSVDDFMGTMGIMSAALAFCCRDCHPGAGSDVVVWENDTPRKRT